MTAGYSGTPLARKLSLKPGQRVWWENMPDSVLAAIEPEEIGLQILPAPEPPIDAAHVFVTSRAALEDAVARLRPLLAPAGFLWISWPKKAARVDTDLTEDVVRDLGLPTGLVDVKVCAVDSTWSALKLMIRRELRKEAIANNSH
jgi:hypothetical protein